MYLIKYKYQISNANKTLKNPIDLKHLIKKIDILDVKNQLISYERYQSLFFWDLGASVTDKVKEHISDNPILVIICQDDVYVGKIVGLIHDSTGRLGDVIGWSRFYKKPWMNILLINNVKYILKWHDSPIYDYLQKGRILATNFYEFTGSIEQEMISLLNKHGIYPDKDSKSVEDVSDELLKTKNDIKKETEFIDEEIITHNDIEGILLSLGNLLGFETYTPDKSRKYNDVTLGEISTLKDIPHFTYPRILNIVKDVDVIWFKEGYPNYCFEVEHTTNITEGLLRLYQISGIPSKFFIIAPSSRISKFEREIMKDPFFKIQNRYSFRSYDNLLKFYKIAKEYYDQKKNFLV